MRLMDGDGSISNLRINIPVLKKCKDIIQTYMLCSKNGAMKTIKRTGSQVRQHIKQFAVKMTIIAIS